MTPVEVKQHMLEICKQGLEKMIQDAKEAMDRSQDDANQHIGAMLSRYDTFKEEAQALRDGYARQYQALAEALAIVRQIQAHPSDSVKTGAIIRTTDGAYFISTGLIQNSVPIEGVQYHFVSYSSPFVQQARRAKVGDKVQAGERSVIITAIE